MEGVCEAIVSRIRLISLDEIEGHLSRLGRGNHCDNLKRLQRFAYFGSVTLGEAEFLNLVFLQNGEVARIVPERQDRKLRSVAQRAINLGQPRLSDNWDLAENLDRMRNKLGNRGGRLEPLVLCEARDGEEMYGHWYIQDGSHRALGYATLLLLKEVCYDDQEAYCAMSDQKYQSLLR